MKTDSLEYLTDLPTDGQSILSLAARSLFDVFANASEGMLLVDRSGRVVWINDHYRQYLPALGFEKEEDFVGRPVVEVVQNTQMGHVMETGKPILIDLLSNKAGTFLVSRFPLRDEAGVVIGALGVVLFDQPETNLQPLMAKFALMQRELDEARNALAAQRKTGPALRQARYSFASFVGTSGVVTDLKRQAKRAAQTHSPVLLLGETGTGKELLAHAIHASSPRARGPLVSVNIAAVPDSLLEAEFFGVVPGAFTGADRKGRDGKFKLADGGTLFLDEIGDMPFELQTRLLRVLSEGTFYRVGGAQPVRVDVRIVAATHQPLEERVQEGKFREDLFHRLNVIRLRLPALRERREDVADLAKHFLSVSARAVGVPVKRLSDAAVHALSQFDYPGNVRQLENFCHWLTVMAPGQTVEMGDLPPEVRAAKASAIQVGSAQDLGSTQTWQQLLALDANVRLSRSEPEVWTVLTRQFERTLLQSSLEVCRGRRVEAAARLGMGRNTITRKLRELGMDPVGAGSET
jgi:transcriptional regulator with PAS, ATPase and Fis domain